MRMLAIRLSSLLFVCAIAAETGLAQEAGTARAAAPAASSAAPASCACRSENANGEPASSLQRDQALLITSGLAAGLGALAAVLLVASVWTIRTSPWLSEPLGRRADEGFAFTTLWGGFGGGRTGWSISPRLAQLIGGLVLAMLAVGLAHTTLGYVFKSPAASRAPSTGAAAAEPKKAPTTPAAPASGSS